MDTTLAQYFDKSATTVRHYADLIEHDYARPFIRYAAVQFREKPIAMTFLAIFAALSALPLLAFIGLSLFTFSSIAFFAFTLAAISFMTIEAIFVSCLVFALWSLFIVAGFTTVVVASVYWTTRLAALVTHQGPSGVLDWAYETRQHFFVDPKKREVHDESDGSAVLVDRDSQSMKKPKVEEVNEKETEMTVQN